MLLSAVLLCKLLPQVKKRRIVQFPEKLDSEIALTWRNVSPIVTILGDGKLKLLHIFLFCLAIAVRRKIGLLQWCSQCIEGKYDLG